MGAGRAATEGTVEAGAMSCRYLVDSRWFKQWKKYVGFDSWDMFGAGDPSLFPGPVDNSGLFSGEWCLAAPESGSWAGGWARAAAGLPLVTPVCTPLVARFRFRSRAL